VKKTFSFLRGVPKVPKAEGYLVVPKGKRRFFGRPTLSPPSLSSVTEEIIYQLKETAFGSINPVEERVWI